MTFTSNLRKDFTCLRPFKIFFRVCSVIIRQITMICSLISYWRLRVILPALKSLSLDHCSLSLGRGMWTSFPPARQVQFNCSQTNVGLVLITFTTDSSTISCSVIVKTRVLTRTENKLKLIHYREYYRPPWLLGWQSRVRIPSTWWNFLEHKRQPWSYTQGFWTAMYVTQYHYKTVP